MLLAAVREGYPSLLADARLPQHRLGVLAPAEAVRLLDASARQLPWVLRDRVLSEAAGNPLALLELPVTAARREPAGSDMLPLTQRLEQAFAARVSDLPEATRLLLLLAAAELAFELGQRDPGLCRPVRNGTSHPQAPA